MLFRSQLDYISYFKDNALEVLLNNHVNIKHAPIGGTSAGMEILGSNYFSAQNGTVTSAQALSNPYNSLVALGHNDFLNIPFMNNVITDTHYDNPDRRGRHATFLARLKNDYSNNVYGIACNEYVAVCVGNDGIAHVYGDYPNYQQFAYFIQPNCSNLNPIETCQSGQPLTWNYGGEALKVYKVPGTMNGANYFNISNEWQLGQGSGGSWENWSVNNGVLSAVAGTALISCALSVNENELDKMNFFPNPFRDYIRFENSENAMVEIFDSLGKRVFVDKDFISNTIDTSQFSSGLYFVKIQKDGKTKTKRIIKN